ncbi:hypothetical protein QTP86_009745 [Hemibagrus guttatus]|nr:hypothetical protein QTP86_009745 [Hemibagrus guttatus]
MWCVTAPAISFQLITPLLSELVKQDVITDSDFWRSLSKCLLMDRSVAQLSENAAVFVKCSSVCGHIQKSQEKCSSVCGHIQKSQSQECVCVCV